MALRTLNEYAKSRNITYELVRRNVNKYAEELGDTVIQGERGKLLTEEAVAILDRHRLPKTITVSDETVIDLRKENESLKSDLDKRSLLWANERAELLNRMADLKTERLQLLADNQKALTDNKELSDKLSALEGERASAEALIREKDERIREKDAALSAAETATRETTEKLTEAESRIHEKEEALTAAETDAREKGEKLAAAEAELERLRSRGFFARLFNK